MNPDTHFQVPTLVGEHFTDETPDTMPRESESVPLDPMLKTVLDHFQNEELTPENNTVSREVREDNCLDTNVTALAQEELLQSENEELLPIPLLPDDQFHNTTFSTISSSPVDLPIPVLPGSTFFTHSKGHMDDSQLETVDCITEDSWALLDTQRSESRASVDSLTMVSELNTNELARGKSALDYSDQNQPSLLSPVTSASTKTTVAEDMGQTAYGQPREDFNLKFDTALNSYLSTGVVGPSADDRVGYTSLYDALSEETRQYLDRCRNKDHVQTGTSAPKEIGWTSFLGDTSTRLRREGKATVLLETLQQVSGNEEDDTDCFSVSVTEPTSYRDVENGRRSENLEPAVYKWLISLNLPHQEKYLRLFEAHEIDWEMVKSFNEEELKKIGVTAYGPLNKILHSIRSIKNEEARHTPTQHRGSATSLRRNIIQRPASAGPMRSRLQQIVEKQVRQRGCPASHQALKNDASSEKVPSRRGERGQPILVGEDHARSRAAALVNATPLEATSRVGRSMEVSRRRRGLTVNSQSLPRASRMVSVESRAKSASPGRYSALASPRHVQHSKGSLVERAERDIAKALARRKQLDKQEAQKREQQQKFLQHSREKRAKLASDHLRRLEEKAYFTKPDKEVSRGSNSRKTHRQQKPQARNKGPPKTQHSTKLQPYNEKVPLVARIPQVSSETPQEESPLVFEGQLDHLESKIEKLLQSKGDSQADPTTWLSCIDDLHEQLSSIQSLVARQRSKISRNTTPAVSAMGGACPNSSTLRRLAQQHNSNALTTSSSPSTPSRGSNTRKSESSTNGEIKFSEKDLLGEGSFTQVFAGRFQGNPVAVKRIKIPVSAVDKPYVASEIGFLQGLHHPCLVQVLSFSARVKAPLLICELLPRGSVRDLLNKNQHGPDHCAFYQLAEDLTCGLAHLHSLRPCPVMHLRLTSRNLLVTHRIRGKISDVGLSKMRHQASLLSRQFGSADDPVAHSNEWSQMAWMAPELLSAQTFDASVDVYSAGVVLWEMLLCERPYHGLSVFRTMERIRAGPGLLLPQTCPPDLRGLLERCWHKDPGRRPSAKDLVLILGQLKFPADWQLLLQKGRLSAEHLQDVATARQVIRTVLAALDPGFMPLFPPGASARDEVTMTEGPCGLLDSALPAQIDVQHHGERLAAVLQDTGTLLTGELLTRHARWDVDSGPTSV